MNKLLRPLLRIVLGVAIGIPLLLYPLLYFRQEAMLFHPRQLSAEQAAWAQTHYPGSPFKLQVAANITVHGWLRKAPLAGPLLIYFGGNAEEVSHLLDMPLPPEWSLLLVNYRGYGDSGGEPGEVALFHDALAIYDAATREFPLIAVMGRSLGTGVAVYLSSQRPVCGTVLVSPYDSIRSLAQAMYPYVPVSWLLKHHFDAASYAPQAPNPALVLLGEQDSLIPPSHSEILVQAWGGTVTSQRFTAADHHTITSEPDYWPTINTFLLSPHCTLQGNPHD